jgi:hypothetical protein
VGRYLREQYDLGLEGTHSWLRRSGVDLAEAEIEPVRIICPDVSKRRSPEAREFEKLRHLNESELHTQMKLASILWLRKASRHPCTIKPEVIYYTPSPDIPKDVRIFNPLGWEFPIRRPQVLWKNEEGFPCNFGSTIRIDVYSKDISVELGATQPLNLLQPLMDRTTKRAVWFPFPDAAKQRGKTAMPGPFELTGYSIRLPVQKPRYGSQAIPSPSPSISAR